MMHVSPLRAALAGLVLLAGCAGLPPQQDHVARNGLRVYDRGERAFEVIAQPGTAGPAYFCAAGDFAAVRRNARAADRVVMIRPDAPSIHLPGYRSATFAIAPPGPRSLPLIATVPMRQAGASLTVATAQSMCRTTRNAPRTL